MNWNVFNLKYDHRETWVLKYCNMINDEKLLLEHG